MGKILGLDVGIGSLGWAVIDEDARRIVDLGVRIFESGEEQVSKTGKRTSQIRRDYRSTKRLNKRRRQRKLRLKKFLQDNDVISIEEVNNAYRTKGFNPDVWKFRSEGLTRKLEPIELASVLINFANYRGYQDFYEDSDDKETGKLSEAKNRINNIYEEKKSQYRTIGQMIYEDPAFRSDFNGKIVIRNRAKKDSNGKKETDYKYLIDRKYLREELKILLSCQCEFGYDQFTPDAIDECNSILFKQRDFEDGPGPKKGVDDAKREAMINTLKGNQKYTGFDELIGNCPFYPEEQRGHKNSQLYDMYVLINTLSQFAFYKDDQDINLPESIVMELRQLLFENNGVITKKQFEKICKNKKIEIMIPKELSKTNLIKAPYIQFLSKEELFSESLIDQFSEEYYCDESSLSSKIGLIIAKYATPRRREEEFELNLKATDFSSEADINKIKVYKSAGGASVSFRYMKEAVEAYFNGMKYGDFQAVFYKEHPEKEKRSYLSENGKLLPISDPDMVRNPVVYRGLNETRKVVNAIMGKYKDITTINVEVARDIGKSFEQRSKSAKFQRDNETKNEQLRTELIQKLSADGYNIMLSDKLMDRFSLWKSQEEICVYSGEKIYFAELVSGTTVQIDHIIPQSKILDETLNNKVLVKTEENQKKGNNLPLQYMNEEQSKEFKNRVCNLYRKEQISRIKKEYLLLDFLDDETRSGFVDRNINDTRTISKYIANYFSNAYAGKIKVNVIKGAVTSRFRKRWLGGNRFNKYIPSIYGLEEKTRKLHYYHHAIDAVVVANLTRPYIELAQDYVKFESIRMDIKYHEKHGNAATANALYKDLIDEKAKTVDKMHTHYGMNREYVMSVIDDNKIPSICENLREEVEVRVPLDIKFDAKSYSEMAKAYKEVKLLLKGVRCDLKADDSELSDAIDPDTLEEINSRITIVDPDVACFKSNGQIIYADKPIEENMTAESIMKSFDSYLKNLQPRDINGFIKDIRMVSDEEYSDVVNDFYKDKEFADSIELPYVSFKINRKFKGSMIYSDNPVSLDDTGFNTIRELENDINNNLKTKYYVRFNKGVGEVLNYTIYDARSYYCMEIYIDNDQQYQIRGIRYVDVYCDRVSGKMVLLKKLPEGCRHYMYLFKNEYIKAYKNGKLRNNGFGAYRGVENINEDTGKIRLFSNTNLKGRDVKINLAGECIKIEMSILGHIIGERKCGDQSLFIAENEST